MHLIVKNLQQKNICISEKNTILQSLGEAGIDWMQACGGKGRCATCKMIVLEGIEYLIEPTEAEKKLFLQKRLQTNERLTCQAKPKCALQKNIVIQVPKMYQLPHIIYSE